MANEVLFKRKLRVQVDTLVFEGVTSPGLRIVCKARKTLAPEPNKCDLTIYNIAPEHRASLMKIGRPAVQVDAGYEGQMTQIFRGHVLRARLDKSNGDVMAILSTNDSGAAKTARIKQSFPKGAKTGDVLRALVKALEVKVGNLDSVVRTLNAGKAASIYAEGVTIAGHASHAITKLCESAGLEWSVQDNVLQILDVGKALASRAIVLTEDKLTVSPSITSKGLVEGQTFLQQDMTPGRQVQIDHEFLKVAARLESCAYTIDTHADNWYVDFEAKGPPPK